jgi:hypothetical protein
MKYRRKTLKESLRGRVWIGLGILASLALPCSIRAQRPVELSATATSKKTASVVYVNRRYAFRFDLPSDWKGYRILAQRWDGTTPGPAEPRRKEYGPRIVIRDPRWTKAQPRQDIPIMIFTLEQWKKDLIVSAAPIGPSEFGRNSRYVFALPPRYNFAFPEGYKEVKEILEKKPLHPF